MTSAAPVRLLLTAERAKRRQLRGTMPTLRLHEFVREAWPIVEPATAYVHGRHIEVIAAHLEAVSRGQITNLLINIPPRFMKSLLTAVFWPAWEWTRDPGARFVFASYRERLAIRDSVKTRRLVESPWYQRRWPLVRLLADQNEKMRFDNTWGGFRITSSVEGGNTGEGADYSVADDPHNARKIWSEAQRENVCEWWDDVMSSRTGRFATNRRVVVMQRLHEEDLSGHILAEKGDYVHLFLPQEYDPSLKPGRGDQPARSIPSPLGRVDWRTTPGELLWPERFTREVVNGIKRSGMSAYAYGAQHQQVPAPAEGSLFKREHWRYWEPPAEHFGPVMKRRADGTYLAIIPRKLPFNVEYYAQSWDFTFKGKEPAKERDNVAGHVYAKFRIDAYLMDRVYDQLSFTETVKAVRDLTTLWPQAGRKWYEDAANGPAIADTLRGEIQGMIAVPTRGEDLLSRAHAISGLQEGGHIYLPHPVMCPWVTELEELLGAFPNAAHDDDVAALCVAMRKMFPQGTDTAGRARSAQRWPVTRQH